MRKWFALFLVVGALDCQSQSTDSRKIKLELIAMQYYGGILNRSYVVQFSDSLIFGGRVRGAIAAGVSRRNSKENLENPYYYADPSLISSYKTNVIDPALLREDNANFLIRRADVLEIEYTPRKKWGMGDVVHTGRLFLHLKNGKRVELILLGRPDIDEITSTLQAKIH